MGPLLILKPSLWFSETVLLFTMMEKTEAKKGLFKAER